MEDKIASMRSFNRFYTNFLGLLNEKLLDSPISLTEGRILFEIEKHPGCKAKDLIDLLSIDRGYLSRTLSRLQSSGLISAQSSSEDKRAKVLSIAAKGKRVLENINQSASSQIQEILEALPAEAQERLIKAMVEIRTILSDPE